MQKACVILEVPSIEQSYDIMVPTHMTVKAVSALLAQAVNELSRGRYVHTGDELLYRRYGAQLLHPARVLSEYGIRDGEHFMLF